MWVDDVETARRLLAANVHRRSLPERFYEDIVRTSALLKGHFELQSGEHSEYFLRFSQLGWDEDALARIVQLLLEQHPFESARWKVLCSEAAGLFLGSAVARQASTDIAVLKVDARKRPTEEVREGALLQGERFVIMDDVVTQGRSLDVFLRKARSAGAVVEGVLTFAALKPQAFTAKLQAEQLRGSWLVETRWPTHAPAECPVCQTSGELPIPAFELI